MKIEEEIKQPKFRDAYQKAAINLLFTASRFESRQQEFFRPYGITLQQFNILRILRGQNPNRITGVEIKSRMLDKNSDVSRLLERLLRKKLINKTPSVSDKRAADIGITAEGMTLLEKIDHLLEASERNGLGISEGEALTLSDLLDRCRG